MSLSASTIVKIPQAIADQVLPNGWHLRKLGDVCRVVGGSTPSSGVEEYWNGDIVWITPTDLGKLGEVHITSSARHITEEGYNNCRAEIVPVGSVILSSRAPIGHLGIAAVPLCTNQGCKSFVPCEDIDSTFLYFSLKQSVSVLQSLGSGATFAEVSKTQLENFKIAFPPLPEQKRISAILKDQMSAVERARAAAEAQLEASKQFINAVLRESLNSPSTKQMPLHLCINEVTKGIGENWNNFPVLGATRAGLAPAKEGVGKIPQRYKPVINGTIFYNPMRILLGSIAMIDEDKEEGITSPDYVVLRCKEDILHPRWFYNWLRSPYGEDFIKSMSRGAVRERMLFKRLAAAEISIPLWQAQLVAAEKLRAVARFREKVSVQLDSINKLPAALLRQAFTGKL